MIPIGPRFHDPLTAIRRTGWIAVFLCSLPLIACADGNRAPVQYGRDIRRLISDNCFACHGPDSETRAAGLRFDLRESALAELDSGNKAIVPHDPAASEMLQRILATDPDLRMPPPESGKQLTDEQIDLIRRWIEEGANWEEHWSFQPLQPATPPEIDASDWVRNPIDRFVLERLQDEQLAPSPEADAAQWVRRVTFDLTGLPPTPEQIESFLTNPSPHADIEYVDQLMNSPAYGERMAQDWLDSARYADTHGFVIDAERSMWRWRDWVIQAFNAHMPFDQFTIEQLAGDLLPNATLEQQIASGFNRNHVINGEFGAIDEEYRVENVADRVQTTGTIWMGLTMQCARCHDHKYDPLTQKEYYELFSLFDQIGENGVDGVFGNAGPLVNAPLAEQTQQVAELNQQLQQANARLQELLPQIEQAQEKWEAEFRQPIEDFQEDLLCHFPADGSPRDRFDPDSVREEDLAQPFSHGISGKAIALFGLNSIKVSQPRDLDIQDAFTLSAWINFSIMHGERSIFTRMRDAVQPDRGYALQIHDGKLWLALVHEYPGNCIEIKTVDSLPAGSWMHVAATYDGSASASGVQLYVNGQKQAIRVHADSLNGSFLVNEALTMGDGTPNANARGSLDDLRIYRRVLTCEELQRVFGVSIHSLLAIPPADRNPVQTRYVREYFLKHVAPPEWQDCDQAVVRIRRERDEANGRIPSVMVMKTPENRQPTRILNGGAYDQPGDPVSPGTPAFLPPVPEDWGGNRLGFAKWLVSGEHPLTARVIVNRYWQMFFGTGLVRTADDFGVQGEAPSHPELLDWLAQEFVASGWDLQALQRLVVTSATYRQSSQAADELWKRDPDNRLLARGPRYRLPAEMIRDQALAHSGLLVNRIGGPSVKPYQPEGIWQEGAFDPTGNRFTAQWYVQDHGENLYRRSLYTFWKRTAPPPSMLVLDAPERDRCVITRNRSNTPLQALVLMNDPIYLEASRKFAERMLHEAGPQPEERIRFALELATGRPVSQVELQPLLRLYSQQQQRFSASPDCAAALLVVGESPRDDQLDIVELATCTIIASVILNLDEVLTKN